MATLPTYEYAGAQYADLPRVNTAPQQVAAQGFATLGQNIDRMTAFFQGQAATDAQKAGAKYALENPITEDQLQVAIGAKAPPKIAGAGSIFQDQYLETQGAILRSQLQAQVQNKITAYAAKIEAGMPVDMNVMRDDLRAQIDGYSSGLMQFSPTQTIQLKAAAATSSSLLFKAAADHQVKLYKADQELQLKEMQQQSKPLIRLQFEAAGQIDPETQKPIDLLKMQEIILKPFRDAAGVNPDAVKYYEAMQSSFRTEAKNYLANIALDKDFATNDIERASKIKKGDFGDKSILYKGLSIDEQQDVRKMVDDRMDSLSKARTSFLAQELFSANELERQVYATSDMRLQLQLVNEMQKLAVDPTHIKRARDYIETQANQGPKNDNLAELANITRMMASGDATPQDVIDGVKKGYFKKDTAKTLIINISNPSDDINWGKQVINSSVLIQKDGAPPEIKDADARSAAVVAAETAKLELMKFASTPIDGKLPNSAEIRRKGAELAKGTGTLMQPMYENASRVQADGIRAQLGAAGQGINIDDDAAFEAAIAQATKNKVNPASIVAAKAGRDNYLRIKKQMEQVR
jgi:hypothetical protein